MGHGNVCITFIIELAQTESTLARMLQSIVPAIRKYRRKGKPCVDCPNLNGGYEALYGRKTCVDCSNLNKVPEAF